MSVIITVCDAPEISWMISNRLFAWFLDQSVPLESDVLDHLRVAGDLGGLHFPSLLAENPKLAVQCAEALVLLAGSAGAASIIDSNEPQSDERHRKKFSELMQILKPFIRDTR